jgi:hypothetical protein
VWNEVAQRSVDGGGASLEDAVAVFSQLDLALADTAIALYDGKYHDLIWRPVTAVRLGDTAGNPGITGDPTWTPLAITAPDPSYPGAHSGFSEAAADEAGLSRIFAGQHTRLDHVAGQKLGRQVADFVLDDSE